MATQNDVGGGPQRLAIYEPLYALRGGFSLNRDELRRSTEAMVDAINSILTTADKAKELVANLVFVASYGNDVKTALSPTRRTPPIYRELRKRAGASLGLVLDDLSVFNRVGALNHGNHGDGWVNMLWSKKIALLPLVANDHEHHLFARGVAFANGPRVGVKHVRKWVTDELAKANGTAPAETPPEPEFKLKAGEKLVKHAIPLQSAKARKGFAKDVNKLPKADRRRMKRDLERAAKNMLKMAADIHENDE